MATIITHPLVPVAAAYLIGRDKVPTKLIIAAGIASIIPDLDVIAFRFGISYNDPLGHRGFTHSIFFSCLVGLFAMLFSKYFKANPMIVFLMVFIGACSHGVLDAFTDGGEGIAFFWPFNNERYFFPLRPIEVSPIGISRFLSPRGLDVLISEFWLVWLPLIILIFTLRRKSSKN